MRAFPSFQSVFFLRICFIILCGFFFRPSYVGEVHVFSSSLSVFYVRDMSEDVPLLPSRHGRKTSSRSSSSSSSSASAPNDSVPAPQLLTNFDQALSHLGTYGPWQIVVVGLLWLPAVAAGVIVLLWSFTGLEPKYICFKLIT